MALINCPECEGSVSKAAKSCPHCGFPMQTGLIESSSAAEIAELPPCNPQPQRQAISNPIIIQNLPATSGVQRACPSCHCINPLDARYCSTCGNKLISSNSSGCLVSFLSIAIIGLIYFSTADMFEEIPKPNPARKPVPSATPLILEPSKEELISTPSPIPEDTHRINATVSYDNLNIEIKNQDSFAWRLVEVEINPSFWGDDYKFETYQVQPGDVLFCPISEFTRDDGTRFNQYTTKIKTLDIHCRTPKGYGFCTYESK